MTKGGGLTGPERQIFGASGLGGRHSDGLREPVLNRVRGHLHLVRAHLLDEPIVNPPCQAAGEHSGQCGMAGRLADEFGLMGLTRAGFVRCQEHRTQLSRLRPRTNAATTPRPSAMPPAATIGVSTSSTTCGISANVPVSDSSAHWRNEGRWPPASLPDATMRSTPPLPTRRPRPLWWRPQLSGWPARARPSRSRRAMECQRQSSTRTAVLRAPPQSALQNTDGMFPLIPAPAGSGHRSRASDDSHGQQTRTESRRSSASPASGIQRFIANGLAVSALMAATVSFI